MSYTEDSRSWQELQQETFDELNFRRQNKVCARCGTTAFCYIDEIKKYRVYKKTCQYDHRKNSIDVDAIRRGSHVCTPCGDEIRTGLLGSSSKRIENNEDEVIDKIRIIRGLCKEHKELSEKNITLTNRIYRDSHGTFDDEEARDKRLKESKEELEKNQKRVQQIESEIDNLVGRYSIK